MKATTALAAAALAIVLVCAAATPAAADAPLDTGDGFVWDYAATRRYVWYADATSETERLRLTKKWDCTYCTYDPLVRGFTLTQTVYNATEDSFAIVGFHQTLREVIVAFRGSKDPINFLEDAAAILKVPYDLAKCAGVNGTGPLHSRCGRVGFGFLQYYKSLRAGVLEALSALLVGDLLKGYKLVVIGHSLGGAAAALAGVDLAHVWGQQLPVSVTTFGEPRVGDAAWVAYQQHAMGAGAVTRVVNDRDPVPHLPLRNPLWPEKWRFQHELQEVWERPFYGQIVGGADHPGLFGGLQNYTICSQTDPEDPNCSDSVKPDQWLLWEHNNYMGIPCCKGPNALPNGYPKSVAAAPATPAAPTDAAAAPAAPAAAPVPLPAPKREL